MSDLPENIVFIQQEIDSAKKALEQAETLLSEKKTILNDEEKDLNDNLRDLTQAQLDYDNEKKDYENKNVSKMETLSNLEKIRNQATIQYNDSFVEDTIRSGINDFDTLFEIEENIILRDVSIVTDNKFSLELENFKRTLDDKFTDIPNSLYIGSDKYDISPETFQSIVDYVEKSFDYNKQEAQFNELKTAEDQAVEAYNNTFTNNTPPLTHKFDTLLTIQNNTILEDVNIATNDVFSLQLSEFKNTLLNKFTDTGNELYIEDYTINDDNTYTLIFDYLQKSFEYNKYDIELTVLSDNLNTAKNDATLAYNGSFNDGVPETHNFDTLFTINENNTILEDVDIVDITNKFNLDSTILETQLDNKFTDTGNPLYIESDKYDISDNTFQTLHEFIKTSFEYNVILAELQTLESNLKILDEELLESKNTYESHKDNAYLTAYNEYNEAKKFFDIKNQEYIVLLDKYQNNLNTTKDFTEDNQYDPYDNFYNMQNGYTSIYKENENPTETSYSKNFDGSSKIERIFIDSRNRISTSKSSTNFTFELKDKRQLKYVNKITLLNHNIDFNYQYLINEQNNKFRIYSSAFKMGDKDVKQDNILLAHDNYNANAYLLCYKEITIPIANYSLDSLAKNLQGFIRTATNKFEVTKYNEDVNKFEFKNIPNLDNSGNVFCKHITNEEYIEKDVFMGKMKTFIIDSNKTNKHILHKIVLTEDINKDENIETTIDSTGVHTVSYMLNTLVTQDGNTSKLHINILRHIYNLIKHHDIINYTYTSNLYFTDGTIDYDPPPDEGDNFNIARGMTDKQFKNSFAPIIKDKNSNKKFYTLLFNCIKSLLTNNEPNGNKLTDIVSIDKDTDDNTTGYSINLTKLYILLKNHEYCLTTYFNKTILDKNIDDKFYYFFKFNNIVENNTATIDSRVILNRLENSLANVIGLHPDKLYSGSANTFNFISNKPLALEKDPYIYLSINNYNNYDIFNFDPTTNVDDTSENNKAVSFIINDKDSDKDTLLPYVKFEDGLHINKFNIRLLDFYGSIVNFGNKDFYIELEVESGIINQY